MNRPRKVDALPISVISKKSDEAFHEGEKVQVFIQVISNGFGLYKASFPANANAGYRSYPNMESVLEDFEFSEEDYEKRIKEWL